MKNIFYTLFVSLFILSCTTIEKKSENQQGLIEKNDEKSMVMDAFNKAYLDNDMTGQDAIFAENAVAIVNGQEMSPAEMIEAFMGGREFYNDIKNINPDCEHYGTKGKIKKIIKRPEVGSDKVSNKHNIPGNDVEYEVTNDTKTAKKGDRLRKSLDQIKKD